MKLIRSCQLCALAALALFVVSAKAGTVTTYMGADDGASPSGPFPLSAAAANSFLSAAAGFGSVGTITFESAPLNSLSFTAAPGVAVNQVLGIDYGNPFTGVSNYNYAGTAVYAFNTTPGGSQFLGTSGVSTTFTFSTPTNSFGAYFTGLQTFYGTGVYYTFNDGTSQSEFEPANVNGGAQYFGVTDTSAFSSITVFELYSINGYDAWGMDDVSYNTGAATTTTPEPSSLVLLGTGLLGAFGAARRRFRK